MVESVTVAQLSHKEASVLHRVSVPLVSRLVRAHRTDDRLWEKLASKQEAKARKCHQVVVAAQAIMAEGEGLWRASQVQEKLQREHGVELKTGYIAKVLRSQLGLRYKRVKPIMRQANQEL